MNATPLTHALTNAMTSGLTHALPQDAAQALLIGRVWQPGTGPVLVRVTPEGVYDLSALAQTCSDLLELPLVASRVSGHVGQRLADTPALLLHVHMLRSPVAAGSPPSACNGCTRDRDAASPPVQGSPCQ